MISVPRLVAVAAKMTLPAMLSLSLLAHSARAEIYGAKETILDNGLRVVVVENHRAPVVTHMVWYRVGAMDEPQGKSGIAHFLEHLMFKGTDTLAAGEFSATVARNGGQDNAFTSTDYTAYYQSVASDRLELVMRLESDRMAHLNIDAKHFNPEKKVVLEERSQRTDNEPGAILREQSASSFYRNHPYSKPIIGWRHEIEALELQDAVDFYKRFYTPNNATLVVSGDVVAEDVFALAQKYYGGIPAREIAERPQLSEPPLLVSTRVSYHDPRVRQAQLAIRKQAPSWGTTDDKSSIYALEVLSEIIGGGSTARLYRNLVVDQGIAVGAGAWYSGDNRGPGSFGFYISPSQGVALDTVEAALRTEIAKIVDQGVTEDEVRRAITRLQDSAATARDSLSGPANAIGSALTIGMSLSDVENWPENIGAITADQVNAAAKQFLAPLGEVVTLLLPEESTNTSTGAAQ